MKTEGRQHGVLRSYPTPLSHQRRHVKKADSSSVASLSTKLSTKPADQSSFTGKCGNARCRDCHDLHWVRKYKVKVAKGTNNNWRSMPGMMIGFPADISAGDALAYLATSDVTYDDDDDSTNTDE